MNNLMSTVFDFSGLIDTQQEIHNKGLDDLKEKLQHYKRLGMEEIATRVTVRIKEGTVAAFLQDLGFKLLVIPYSEGASTISYIETSGIHVELLPDKFGLLLQYFDRTLLQDYAESIPLSILRKLPDEAGLKTYVFTAQKLPDPILAFQMTWSETEIRTSRRLIFKKKIEKDVPLYCPYWVGLYEWK